MIGLGEIRRAVNGSWRLARLDPSGFTEFDTTIDGFWRSFWVATILAPAFLWFSVTEYENLPVAVGAVRYFATDAISYVVSWVAFPLAMFYVAKWINRESQYFGYIVAYNWSSILRMAAFLPAQVLIAQDPESASLWAFLAILVTVWILFYTGYIAKIALNVSVTVAVAIVLGDIALTMMILHVETGIMMHG